MILISLFELIIESILKFLQIILVTLASILASGDFRFNRLIIQNINFGVILKFIFVKLNEPAITSCIIFLAKLLDQKCFCGSDFCIRTKIFFCFGHSLPPESQAMGCFEGFFSILWFSPDSSFCFVLPTFSSTNDSLSLSWSRRGREC